MGGKAPRAEAKSNNPHSARPSRAPALDGLDRVKTVSENASGAGAFAESYSYDGNSNLLTETDRRGVVSTNTYNDLNYLTSTTASGGFGQAVTLATVTPDLVGNPQSVQDQYGQTVNYGYDGLHRPLSRTFVFSGQVQFTESMTLDANGNARTFTDRNGRVSSLSYDVLNRPASLVDPAGRKVTWNYSDAIGQVTAQRSPQNLTAVQQSDALGRMTLRQVKFASGTEYDTTATYSGRTSTTIDPIKTQIQRTMSAFGEVGDEIVSPAPGSSAQPLTTHTRFSGMGSVKSYTDQNGRVTSYSADGLNRIGTITYPTLSQGSTNLTESFSYDGENNLLSHVDRAGVTSNMSYDNIGRTLQTQTMGFNGTPIPGTTSLHTDTPGVDTLGSNSYPFAHKRVDTDPLGHVTTYRFDALSRTTSITNAEGNTKVMAYDGVSKVSETDFKGQTTSFGYDPLDRLTSVTDRLKQVTTISYDDTNGLTRTTTDRRGNQKVEVFDALGRLSSVNLGGQPLASYQYDGNGNRTAVIDGLGNQTNYVFDAFNRVTSCVHGVTSQNPNGLQVETFGYDSNGNMTSYSDGVNTVTRVFDELNRLTSSTDGAGNTTQFQYDGRNLMTARIEPNRDSGGNPTSVTHYQYNELGSLSQVTDPAGSVWQYGYDAEQKLTSITDALKNPATTFGYDSMHRLTSVNRPLGMTTTYQYDANSNRTQMIDPLGHKFASTYDALDRASSMSVVNSDTSSPQGRNGYNFGYDPEGNLTSVSESVTSGTTTGTRNYSRTYDARNRLATAIDANGHSLAYSYDAANNLTGFTDAASRNSIYHYDGMNRLSSMTTGGGRAVSYTWQPNSLLSSVSYGNGMSRSYGYDKANRVTSIVNTLGATDTEEFDYSYDANSNRTGETRKFDGAATRSLSYGYDALNRLTQANYGGSSVMNYGYDAVGNRLTEQGTDPSGASVNKTYAYDALNRLSTMTDSVHSANSLAFAFDLNGNLTSQTDGSGNQRQYSYDAFNQALTASEVSGGTTTQLGSYDYDFQGRRISRTAGGSTLQYVYSGLNVVNEFGSSGQVVNSYDYGTDLVSAQIGGEGERLYFHDALGSTTALSSGTGSTVARYEYDAWGKQISAPQPSLNRVNYTGYRHDDETGLEYAMARYYDGSLGRFDSFDPVTETKARESTTQGLNFYGYSGAAPLRFTDPNGETWIRVQQLGAPYYTWTDASAKELEGKLGPLQTVVPMDPDHIDERQFILGGEPWGGLEGKTKGDPKPGDWVELLDNGWIEKIPGPTAPKKKPEQIAWLPGLHAYMRRGRQSEGYADDFAYGMLMGFIMRPIGFVEHIAHDAKFVWDSPNTIAGWNAKLQVINSWLDPTRSMREFAGSAWDLTRDAFGVATSSQERQNLSFLLKTQSHEFTEDVGRMGGSAAFDFAATAGLANGLSAGGELQTLMPEGWEFPNTIPQVPLRSDAVATKAVELTKQEGGWVQVGQNGTTQAEGSYLFVQQNGRIFAAPHGSIVDEETIGHIDLARGAPVEYAGEVEFGEGGRIVEWSNSSGHYLPSGHLAFQSKFGLERFRSSFYTSWHPNEPFPVYPRTGRLPFFVWLTGPLERQLERQGQ